MGYFPILSTCFLYCACDILGVWDNVKDVSGTEDILPLWIADMERRYYKSKGDTWIC